MVNSAEPGNLTGRSLETGRIHNPELIMHWMDVCSDPAAHKDPGASKFASNPRAHRDQLVAVWIERVTLPQTLG